LVAQEHLFPGFKDPLNLAAKHLLEFFAFLRPLDAMPARIRGHLASYGIILCFLRPTALQ